MSVIIIRAVAGQLDPTQVSVGSGIVEAVSSTPRLTSDDGSQLGWLLDGVDGPGFSALVGELRGLFGNAAEVVAVTIGTAPAAPGPRYPELQEQHNRGTIAQ